MSACARIATLLLLAIHLAAAALPCPSAKLPDRAPEHPCPAHAKADAAHSTWLDSFCPCGCESGAPPSIDGSRIPPALLLAQLTALAAPGLADAAAPPLRLVGLALAPPDPVPLAIA